MGERYFAWDEITEGLILLGVAKAEDEDKRRKKQAIADHASKIYCPHAYLILSYQETLNDSEKIKFRKHYLRKVTPNEPDVIILQDIKDLVLFLLITPVSPQFIHFFHLPIVDRFLRALIIYFQHYVEIWEDLMQERAATMKKAPNPLARGHRSRYAEEMRALRCVLGREYADLILGCQSGPQYHHMMAGKKRAITQSQGEKDLRIFEALTSTAHRVVWIALQRKHYNLIGIVDIDVRDPKIAYLKNALLIEEEMLSQLGIRVGILGHNRSDYDIMLMPNEVEEPTVEPTEINSFDKKILETRKSVPMDKISDMNDKDGYKLSTVTQYKKYA
ncbi:39s ribosomal protein mitochondrial [Lasius niger]|uniref:39s ribosomal protein mitochondrial n=1 Tax=Lasius niger TaxID=67767 RepID=A0A0J7KTJ4_LASNI|nr:39s ribosomal protein mitochondrial [Lasius niger]